MPYTDDPMNKEGASPFAAADRISQILGRLEPAPEKGMAYISVNSIGEILEASIVLRNNLAKARRQGMELQSDLDRYGESDE